MKPDSSKLKKTIAVVCFIAILFTSATMIPSQANAQVASVPISTLFNFHSIMDYMKTFTLDRIAVMIANQILQRMTASVVNWINSGFQGSPAFLTNPEGYFLDVADQVTGQFIAGNGPLSALCSTFSADIRIALALQQGGQYGYGRYTCTLGSAVNNFDGLQTGVVVAATPNGTTVGDIANGNILRNPNQLNVNGVSAEQAGSQINNFVNGNFSIGGWPAFIALSVQPQNNPYGAYLMAQSDLQAQIAARHAAINTDLNRGAGFLSWQSCTDITNQITDTENWYPEEFGLSEAQGRQIYRSGNQTFVTGQTNLGHSTSVRQTTDKSGNIKYEDCQTKTPGSVISGTLQKQLNVPADKLVLVKTISDSIDAIMGALVNQMLTQGLASLSGQGSGGSSSARSYTQQLYDEANYQNSADWQNARSGLQQNLNPTNPTLTNYKSTYDQTVSLVAASQANYQAARACFSAKLASAPTNNYGYGYNNGQSQIQNEISAIDSVLIGQVNPLLASLSATQASINSQINQSQNGGDDYRAYTFDNLHDQISDYSGTLKNNLNAMSSTTMSVTQAQRDLKNAQTKSAQWNTDAAQYQAACVSGNPYYGNGYR